MTNDVTFSLSQVIWLCGGVMAIVACVGWLVKPLKKLDNHENRITALEESRQERKQTDQYMMRALNSIVNHMIDGNGINELKRVRDEYQENIIKHHS